MNKLTVGSWPLAALLLFGCASAPPPQPSAPPLTAIPRSVLDSFCARLHDEGISAETAKNVIKTTQPLITSQSMAGLAEAAFYTKKFDPAAAADAANHEAVPMPVEVPEGSCAWHAVEAKARRSVDTMTIELSSPFTNPVARNSLGILARVSLADDSATWYWVPLGDRGGRWISGAPMPLGMR